MLRTLNSDVDATPSELQRDYKRLLDLAEDGTVINIRQRGGKPAITLVSNDSWRAAMVAKAWLSILSAVVKYATGRVLQKKSTVCPSEFSWLQLFEDDNDIRTFVDELSGAINGAATGTRTWDDVESIVEEWQRSASLIEHPDLIARFRRAKENKDN